GGIETRAVVYRRPRIRLGRSQSRNRDSQLLPSAAVLGRILDRLAPATRNTARSEQKSTSLINRRPHKAAAAAGAAGRDVGGRSRARANPGRFPQWRGGSRACG